MKTVSSAIDWHSVLTFGVKFDGVLCAVRESAYALFADNNRRLAIVSGNDGTYLPGGGIEPGETMEAAILREGLEECGLIVHPLEWRVFATQYAYSKSEATCFEKHSVFADGIVRGSNGQLLQRDHELRWVTVADAMQSLSHESHRWAVEQWLRR